jgi:hypothetical protein
MDHDSMPEEAERESVKAADRKLGDEWLDWDGSIERTDPVRKRLFASVAALAVAVVICAVFAILWLIEPRLIEIDLALYTTVKWVAYAFCAVVALWLLFFVFSAVSGLSILGRLLVIPLPVNWLLNIALRVRKIVGVSSDRLFNSFLRIHNILLPGRRLLSPEELLVLMPRCLRRDDNAYMRSLRDRYKFKMATSGGGQQARQQIKTLMPKAIIALACERDLLSGFLEVNPHIPVIGLPIMRPEGPCKNTEIDKKELESLIRKFLSVN